MVLREPGRLGRHDGAAVEQLLRETKSIAVLGIKPESHSDQAAHYVPAARDGVWLEVPGEVMHFAVNKVSNAKRGKSDLATRADLSKLEADLIKWDVGAIIATTAVFAAIVKLL